MKNTLLFALVLIVALHGTFYSKVRAESHEISDAPKFIFPAGCTYGQDCWAVNYVDVNPVEGAAQDYKCNPKTYDAHKGVDFALGSVAQMRAGVDVFAAASGKVLRVRDGESDHAKTQDEIEQLRADKRECGNGVLVDHGNGLQSVYCHLKKGSVIAKRGQSVKAGQKIGEIGESGATQFPHLHFTVIWEGGVIDPYTGMLNTDGCGQSKESMWHIGLPMDYQPVAIFNGGFRAQPPDFASIERGDDPNLTVFSRNSSAFIFWVGFYNVEAGDLVRIEVLDPDGQTFITRDNSVDTTRVRQYFYTGRKLGRVQLKNGTYKALATITRTGAAGEKITREKSFSIKVQ
tara:strand:- start:1953 stop:2990 length:1038 start_codon:yes stop_codon:yes gene_type:complete